MNLNSIFNRDDLVESFYSRSKGLLSCGIFIEATVLKRNYELFTWPLLKLQVFFETEILRAKIDRRHLYEVQF